MWICGNVGKHVHIFCEYPHMNKISFKMSL